MSGDTLRAILAVVVASHGVGHTLFLVPCLGIARWGQTSHSWLLTNLVGDPATRAIGSVLWLAATVGFVAAGIGLFGQQPWWRTAVLVSAAVSLVTMGLFAGGLIRSALNAVGMDVLMLVALLLVHLPPVTITSA